LRLVLDHLHHLQTVCDDRLVREDEPLRVQKATRVRLSVPSLRPKRLAIWTQWLLLDEPHMR
jgi:hypothetical protein